MVEHLMFDWMCVWLVDQLVVVRFKRCLLAKDKFNHCFGGCGKVDR